MLNNFNALCELMLQILTNYQADILFFVRLAIAAQGFTQRSPSAGDRRLGLIPLLLWSSYVSHILLKFHLIILHGGAFCSLDEDL